MSEVSNHLLQNSDTYEIDFSYIFYIEKINRGCHENSSIFENI